MLFIIIIINNLSNFNESLNLIKSIDSRNSYEIL